MNNIKVLKEIREYGDYTLKVNEWSSPLGKDKNAIVGSIYRNPYSEGDRPVGGFVYGCSLSVSVEAKADFKTFVECSEVVMRYFGEISVGEVSFVEMPISVLVVTPSKEKI